ncbi:ImmA/IrrE family metallo-endopeptidase [Fimbriiglobus ruber]|uniref:IrrE N-terminal-like domain-containing protein n=1 Tax=Fimbriiglobus ruber TaxID=1908690 RepID=A0A225D772_9BACT|nr:ImmA/IrrE family metallo-endopeptidase [Fimbriiglobus ruber]OWK37302.1 hypothetical protein FRUB_06422 [Fimbriiglobus ruber]
MPTRTSDAVCEAVSALRQRAGIPVIPDRRGPVPLDRFFQAENVTHVAIQNLSTAAVVDYLVAERYVSGPHVLSDIEATADPLEGFLFWVGDDGLAFITEADILPRRRFSAAHELGHAVMHRSRMNRFRADAKIADTGEPIDPMEAEANRFAAELLMPEEVVRVRADDLTRVHGCCPRGVLVYRLASELLVSREAVRYRLENLGVGDE